MTQLKDLKARILINTVAALVTAAALVVSQIEGWQILFVLFIATISIIALSEYYNFSEKKDFSPARKLGFFWAFCYVGVSYVKARGFLTDSSLKIDYLPSIVQASALFTFFVYFARGFNPHRSQTIANIAISFFGILYIATPCALIVQIAYVDNAISPLFWLLYLLATTKAADLGGYFFGKLLGKRRLIAHISPNKTVAGAVAGLLSAMVVSLGLALLGQKLYQTATISLPLFALVGLIMGLASELGDLAESLLKRDANVKDSNRLPAVGGILDLIDSLLFTAPLLYVILKMNILTPIL